MKSKLFMALVAVFLTLPFITAYGECGEDPGVRDTVRIGNAIIPVVTPGQLISIPVYIYSDEDLAAMTLGFQWSSPHIRYASVLLSQELQDLGFTTLLHRPDTTQQIIGVGVIHFEAGVIPASNEARLMFTVRFMTKTGAVPTEITIDSTFFGAVGPFELAKAGGIGELCPEFSHMAAVDIRLPVQEFDGPVLPETYSISQNNPNPFNPTTSIDFALPTAAKTKIEVFNILGQKVKTLVDEYLTAGNKRVEWDGTDENGSTVASGIYLYRMTANDYTETKKMMLMK